MTKFGLTAKFTFDPTTTKLDKEDGDVQRDALPYAIGGGKRTKLSERWCSRGLPLDADYNTLVTTLMISKRVAVICSPVFCPPVFCPPGLLPRWSIAPRSFAPWSFAPTLNGCCNQSLSKCEIRTYFIGNEIINN